MNGAESDLVKTALLALEQDLRVRATTGELSERTVEHYIAQADACHDLRQKLNETATPFEDWRKTRAFCSDLSPEFGEPWKCPGFVYEGGFIAIEGGQFVVPMPQQEPRFASLDAAETFLWNEWVKDELGNVDFQP